LVQIIEELVDIPPFVYYQDGGHRHLGFLIPPFWTTHDVPVVGFHDQPEFVRNIPILPFRDFGWKMPIPAILRGFGGF